MNARVHATGDEHPLCVRRPGPVSKVSTTSRSAKRNVWETLFVRRVDIPSHRQRSRGTCRAHSCESIGSHLRRQASSAVAARASCEAHWCRPSLPAQRRKAAGLFCTKGSCLAPLDGREVDFDPDRNRMGGPALGEMSFTQEYFRRLARECELPARFFALLDGDASEYAPEEAEQECCRKHSASATAPTFPDRRG